MKSFIFSSFLLLYGYVQSQDLCSDCEKLYNEKKYEEVVKKVKSFGDKASVNDLVFMGKSYQSLGYQKDAIKAYETLLLIDDQNVDACVAVSALFIDIESYENAKFAAERALKFDKKNVKALYNLGIIYYFQKDDKKFNEHLEKYCSQKDTKVDFTYLRALTNIDQEKYDLAYADLLEVEKLQSNFENISFYQGYCLFKAEKYKEAKEKFMLATTQMNEMIIESYYFLAHTCIKLEEKVDACEAYNKAINLGDESLIGEADDYCVKEKSKKFKQNTRNARITL